MWITLLALPDADLPPPREEPPVVVVAPPPPEPAAPDPEADHDARRDVPPELRLHDGGFEFTLATTMWRPDLRNVIFDGSGTPVGGNDRVAFQRRGHEIGVASPLFWGGEISMHYTRRWFAVGILGFYAGHPGGADAQPTPVHEAANVGQGDPSGMLAYGAAVDLAGAIPVDDHVAFRLGPTLGMRGFSMPISGFEPTTCHSKRGTYPCPERAVADPQLYVEPRLRIEIDPIPRGGLMIGGFAGYDVIGGGFAGGIFLGFNTAHAALLP
jgi:hypothetical protein